MVKRLYSWGSTLIVRPVLVDSQGVVARVGAATVRYPLTGGPGAQIPAVADPGLGTDFATPPGFDYIVKQRQSPSRRYSHLVAIKRGVSGVSPSLQVPMIFDVEAGTFTPLSEILGGTPFGIVGWGAQDEIAVVLQEVEETGAVYTLCLVTDWA